jgi:hypothetical protein
VSTLERWPCPKQRATLAAISFLLVGPEQTNTTSLVATMLDNEQIKLHFPPASFQDFARITIFTVFTRSTSNMLHDLPGLR